MAWYTTTRYLEVDTDRRLVYWRLVPVCIFAVIAFHGNTILADLKNTANPDAYHPATEGYFQFSEHVTGGGDFVLPANRKQKVHKNFKQHLFSGTTCPVTANTWDRSCSASLTTLRPAYYSLLYLYYLF
ncbi:MAG: hypothetical protein H3C48_15015 [Chitinophagaceae bacterium]|nr:hypothetical protein [Chitinophagaceae bacterium]